MTQLRLSSDFRARIAPVLRLCYILFFSFSSSKNAVFFYPHGEMKRWLHTLVQPYKKLKTASEYLRFLGCSHLDHMCWQRMRDSIKSMCGSVEPSPAALIRAAFRSVRIPIPAIKKHQPQLWLVFSWQRMRDSNPRKRSQSPVCYRYTNPLSQGH